MGRAPRVGAWLWLAWWCLLPAAAWAASTIEVGHVDTELREEVYYLDAEFAFSMGEELLDALHNGVDIPLEIQIEVLRPRAWMWDELAYALSQRYRIGYHALSGRYLLANLNSGVQHTFDTLQGALDTLGRIEDLPMLDRGALRVALDYDARLRVRVAVEELPSPLRVWAYVSPEWSLASDWHRWSLQ